MANHLAGKRRSRALPWLGCALLALAGCGAQEAPQPRPDAASVQRGRLLLAQYQCGSCHAIPGVAAARGVAGPPLAAFGLRSYIAGQVPNRPEALARWIVDPAAMVPGTAMPRMGASGDQARDMAAYLHSLR